MRTIGEETRARAGGEKHVAGLKTELGISQHSVKCGWHMSPPFCAIALSADAPFRALAEPLCVSQCTAAGQHQSAVTLLLPAG
jgi:hypothetical protein